jgi:hypothetical protein
LPGLPTPRARDWKTGGTDGLHETVRLLPTPTSSEHTGPGHAAQGGMNLRTTVSLLPTPVAADSDRQSTTYSRGNPTLVGALLPTPTVADSRNTANFRPDGTPYGAGYGQTLIDAMRLLPTPKATDGTKGGPNQRGSSGDLTLPSAVHRIGVSTSPQSVDGNTSPDDPHPDRPTTKTASRPGSSSG